MVYDEQYNIANGIFMMFDKGSLKKIMAVRHSQKKRDEMKSLFPYKKFENYNKSVFILACLYVNFTKMPSSALGSIEFLRDISLKDIQLFKDSIVQYKKYLKDDILLLKNAFGTNISFDEITEYYRTNRIKWYTWYFYLVASGYDLEKLERSRINGILYKKIKTLLVFVSFSQDSMLMVRELMSNSIRIA